VGPGRRSHSPCCLVLPAREWFTENLDGGRGAERTCIQRHGGTKSNTRHRSVQPIIIERKAPMILNSGWLVPGTCTRKRLRIRSAKRTPNTVGARILRKKTLRCKNTLKMCRLCFVIKVSNAPGLGAMNSLGAQTGPPARVSGRVEKDSRPEQSPVYCRALRGAGWRSQSLASLS
jgi:hypothetical protein